MDEKKQAQIERIVEKLQGVVGTAGLNYDQISKDRIDTIEHLIEALIRHFPVSAPVEISHSILHDTAWENNVSQEGLLGHHSLIQSQQQPGLNPTVLNGLGHLMMDRLQGEIQTLEENNHKLTEENQQRRIEIRQLKIERHEMQKQLLHLEKLAVLGIVSSEIVHEFNNFLSSVLGYAQAALFEEDSTERRHALEVIAKTSERAKRISKNLLGLARGQQPTPEYIPIAEVVDDAISLVQQSFSKQNIKIKRIFAPVSPFKCDSSQIFQVCLNLLLNARDAIHSSGGMICVQVLEQNRIVEIRISDTGCGISNEMKEQIFQPFFSTKPSDSKPVDSFSELLSKNEQPHAGLGLSIIRKFVEQHHGELVVESEEGKGSTFIVRLPRLDQQESQTSDPAKTADAFFASDQSYVQELKILLVEDDSFLSNLLQRVISKAGHEVTVCHDGATALGLIWQKTFDLIVMDLVLPEVNGMEVLSVLKHHKHKQPAKIVIMTGEILAREQEDCLFDTTILQKPFRLEELQTIIQQVCQTKASHSRPDQNHLPKEISKIYPM